MSISEAGEAEALYWTGREKLRGGDPVGALEDLLGAEAGSRADYSGAELAFWRGHCYFELGDYADAEKHLQAARREVDADAPSLYPTLGRTLLLELGASQVYLGRPADSIPSLRAVVRDGEADDPTLYAYLFFVDALSSMGDTSAASTELTNAEKLFAGTPEAGAFAALREKLPP